MDEHIERDGAGDDATPFRLLVVPGVTPAKWVRVWNERLPDVRLELVHAGTDDQVAALREGRADAALVRTPLDREGLSVIPLYAETSVVVVPREHVLTAADEVGLEDLADETLVVPLDDVLGWDDAPGARLSVEPPATTADAVALVAAGVGVLVVPQSLARLHHRRDVTYRPVPDAPLSPVALAWVEDRSTDLVEELVGIVRGRTVNSSRGIAGRAAAADPPRDRSPSKSAPSKGAASKGGASKGTASKGRASKGGAPSGTSGGKSGLKPGARSGGKPAGRPASKSGGKSGGKPGGKGSGQQGRRGGR